MALNRVWMPSPNYSSRGGSTVRLIVIHSSEGAQTYQSLGNFFANPSSQVSSHTGIDDSPGTTIGEYVRRDQKAWTAANANPVAVQTELCTPSGASASWSTATWISKTNMLAKLAQWIREEAAAYNIPIVRLTASQATSNGRGVCQHLDLGSWGGGHVDCGPAFPIDTVIAMALSGSPTPDPTPPPEDLDMPGPISFNIDKDNQMFRVDDKGNLVHGYAATGKPWTTELLGGGWDPKAQLWYGQSPSGTHQVWGIQGGKASQCYWSGSKWVTQPVG